MYVEYNMYTCRRYHIDDNPTRISMWQIWIVVVTRTLCELGMYGVWYVRYWYVAVTLLRPPPQINVPLRLKNILLKIDSINSIFINNDNSHWEFIP